MFPKTLAMTTATQTLQTPVPWEKRVETLTSIFMFWTTNVNIQADNDF